MSSQIFVKTFTEVQTVVINDCKKEEIIKLEKNVIGAIEQKIEKLNLLIKNCDIYSYNGALFVNDRYNICANIETIAKAFGLKIKKVECGPRGKNYIITDELSNFLKQLGSNYDLGNNLDLKPINSEIINIIKQNVSVNSIDSNLLEIIENIKKNGSYTTTKSRTISETYEDSFLLDSSATEWVSNEKEVKERLKEFSIKAGKIMSSTNANLRDGTSKLIYERARQMGYSVQEVKKGKQVQLVLVRYE